MMNRRSFLKRLGLVAAVVATPPIARKALAALTPEVVTHTDGLVGWVNKSADEIMDDISSVFDNVYGIERPNELIMPQHHYDMIKDLVT